MSDRNEAPQPPIASLRDELGAEFLRVAREEPRFRLRRRLRYAGLVLVGALLVVPAAVALSGEPADRPLREAQLGSFAECAGLRVTPPAAARIHSEEPALRPSFRELAPTGAVVPEPGAPRDLELSESCAVPAEAPLFSRANRPSELRAAECVAIRAESANVAPERVALKDCGPESLGGAQVLSPTLEAPPGGTRPLPLRSECLTIRANGGQLEVGPCP
jgi:hypothetical protein